LARRNFNEGGLILTFSFCLNSVSGIFRALMVFPKTETATPDLLSIGEEVIAQPIGQQAGELFIVDNSDSEWNALKYLQDWTEIASAIDIASGFFEIGLLLALDGRWQALERIRILLGADMSARTRQGLLEGLKAHTEQILDRSIEEEKDQNDFLNGVPAIVGGIRSGKIECKVYAKKKFHAKAYITHPKAKVIGSVALVGSSNFTLPGLTENVELNIQVRAPGDVEKLQKWFEHYWREGENISDDVIRVLQLLREGPRHCRRLRSITTTDEASGTRSRGFHLNGANGISDIK
jgi:phosphatidylserine/phosphatidylglycerophosphate/cardiolipin synthase-like enzyme